MPKANDFELAPDEIVAAAVEIFLEQGLDAVSMRSVAARLGVSPAPLYSRVGNKDALVDAIADHLLSDLAPPHADDEPWTDYAMRWALELRTRLRRAHDSRLILVTDRDAYVEASRPLVSVMRASGFAADAAVQACRLVMWATVGFVAMETAAKAPPARATRRGRSGSNPHGVTPEDADELFSLQIRYVIDGIARDAQGAQGD
ncbi:TetR/AcrR family transcriptional regulator [Mycobacterium barrassiae]|uniref:TetR/AcrR family transcriptional regulator n=1 Tax=Mycobacterium barrassiae TaxID=319709 RepID=UPI002265BB21|nr:TetR/AcrR family transcriptional regulator [Mycobacterium barrassiae]MCV7303284.1 TetR/AcrR family transcriptional regulator [Mycobacterium barrassiae]